MKNLKKCFGLAGSRKSGLSFAKFACGSMLAASLCASCASNKAVEQIVIEDEERGINMVSIPGESYCIMDTEVTQEIYESVMGNNPSKFKGEKNLPVENVSWNDAVMFCNKLSEQEGLAPVYSVDGETDVSQWGRMFSSVSVKIKCNENANGYRLPTVEEWQYAAKGGQEFKHSGSDNLDEVAWYGDNSGYKTHPVAQKKPNGYGLYDMTGNVWEWCWDTSGNNWDFYAGYYGSGWNTPRFNCAVGKRNSSYADRRYDNLGFRVVRNADYFREE
ncbi:formylglycine-generating enzyme family protein [uncultured Treponema sp.]|uniref:formylglycine-generating enzyme family protein n=1 Tax=uncultured Treponema sp. TaxID=162155 RepID=UPI0025FF27DE|nr:formylglycine-generating enzyme family protein [uncultured Treponema sp.]